MTSAAGCLPSFHFLELSQEQYNTICFRHQSTNVSSSSPRSLLKLLADVLICLPSFKRHPWCILTMITCSSVHTPPCIMSRGIPSLQHHYSNQDVSAVAGRSCECSRCSFIAVWLGICLAHTQSRSATLFEGVWGEAMHSSGRLFLPEYWMAHD